MDKNKFFKQFHKDLATKYKLHPQHIKTIRHLYFYNIAKDKFEVSIFCLKKTKLPKHNKGPLAGKRKHTKSWYLKLSNFLTSCSETDFNNIVQKTEFDKSV